MTTESIQLTVGDREHPAALSVPAGVPTPMPGVVIIHDLLGFRDDARRHCERFAQAGYAAIAPDLYAGRAGCVVKTMQSMIRGEGPTFAVIEAARQRLGARPEVDEARLGVTGFCMGGGFALLAAADQAYAVAAPFYGSVPRKAERLRGLCPTLAQYGALDLAFRGHGRRLSRHLEALEIEHEVLFHEGAGHSFMNHLPPLSAATSRFTPLRAAYNPEVEARAWTALLEFFARHMPARPS